VQLAKCYNGETSVRTEALASKESVSANFLVQILADLRKAGLVESRRGKMGGYLLSRSPEEISMKEIVEAIEPSMLQNQNKTDGESGESVTGFWRVLGDEITEKLSGTKLTEIDQNNHELMFYI